MVSAHALINVGLLMLAYDSSRKQTGVENIFCSVQRAHNCSNITDIEIMKL